MRYGDNARRGKTLSRGFILVFLCALFVRTAFFCFYLWYDPAFFSRSTDCANYINGAKNLINYGVLCEQAVYPPFPGTFRTPGYPLLVAGIYWMSEFSNAAVIAVQIILGALTCALMYRIALKYASGPSALAAAGILALDIVSASMANEILTETFFTLVLTLGVTAFVNFMETRRMSSLVLSSLLTAAAVMTRPILLYFPLCSVVVFLYCFRKNIKKAFLYYAVFNLAFLLVVSPWVIRNVRLGYNGFASVQEMNIYIYKAGWIEERLKGNADYNTIDFSGRFRKVAELLKERGMENTQNNRVKLYKELGAKTLKEHPLLLAEYQLIYSFQVFTSPGAEPILGHIQKVRGKEMPEVVKRAVITGYGFILILLYIAFTAGIFQKSVWSRERGLLFILLLFCYMAALSGEWGAESRFRVPMMPFIAVMAAVGLDYFTQAVKKIHKNVP